MKRLQQIAAEQGVDVRSVEGGNHTKVWVGQRRTTVPRHNEIDERLANAILKQIGGE